MSQCSAPPIVTLNVLCSVPVQCPAHDVRFDSSGVILSPGYPDSYPNLQMCSWSINVEKGYNITLYFEFFQTEREFDVLEVFDGNCFEVSPLTSICIAFLSLSCESSLSCSILYSPIYHDSLQLFFPPRYLSRWCPGTFGCYRHLCYY